MRNFDVTTTKGEKVHLIAMDTIRELTEAPAKFLALRNAPEGAPGRRNSWSHHFSGSKLTPTGRVVGSVGSGSRRYSWKEARQILDGGLPSILSAVEHARQALLKMDLPQIESRARARTWREEGSEVDFDRLRDYHDLPWSDRARRKTIRPGTVELVLEFGANWGWSSSSTVWTTATAIALSEILEQHGYKVGITAVEWVKKWYEAEGVLVSFPIKPAGEPLDVKTLLSLCASQEVYSTFWYALDCTPMDYDGNLGACENAQPIYNDLAARGYVPEATRFLGRTFGSEAAYQQLKDVLGMFHR